MLIDGIDSAECPVSMLSRHPDVTTLVQIFSRAEYAKEGAGAALYGPDLSKWPARMVDALAIVEQEKNRARNAIEEKLDAQRNN